MMSDVDFLTLVALLLFKVIVVVTGFLNLL